MLAIAGTTSAVVLLLAVKQPGTPAAGTAPQAGGAVPPAGSAPAGTGAGVEPAGGQSVLGDEAATQYGPVQVRLTLSGGRITAAEAVKTPSSDPNSRQIAATAVPKLNQAAVAAQSARIDTVSGATYTSEGYIKSLQSALDKAGTAGAPGSGAEEGAGAGSAPEADSTPEPDTGNGTGGSGSDSGGSDSGGSDSGSEAPETPRTPETVLGDVASTQYGDVQVRITVSGDRITAAEAVKTPSSDPNSRRIAATAVPELNQAAVAAQSARIDTVSGASYTSEGYITSLQSALDKAGL
ncbi:FMN-binding protein [Streptomyces sp. NPDC002133]|uniref:FMN-binding protein n=1 Tax=Streptomyces sp. NPDC002133 TaxID=3154409 RepID=UPI00332EAB76